MSHLFHTCCCLLLLLAGAGCDSRSSESKQGDAAGTPSCEQRIRQAARRFARAAAGSWPPLTQRVRTAYGSIVGGHFEEARRLLRQELKDVPNSDAATFYMGYSHYQAHQHAAARPYFETVLGRGPAFARGPSVFYAYGKCLLALGELDCARAAFKAYLRFRPDGGDAHFSLGQLAIEEGQPDEALPHFQRAIQAFARLERKTGASQAQNVSMVHAYLGEVHLQSGALDKARDALETCVRLHPQHPQPHYKLARVLTLLGDEEGASRALEQFELWQKKAGM